MTILHYEAIALALDSLNQYVVDRDRHVSSVLGNENPLVLVLNLDLVSLITQEHIQLGELVVTGILTFCL